MIQKIVNAINGYDFFISYAWSDGRPYAQKLFEQLNEKNYVCFLDDISYKKGDDWTFIGELALRHTGKLLLVGTPDIVKSKPVLHELQVFKKTKREIIPINIGPTFEKFPIDSKIVEIIDPKILRIIETEDRLQQGPSDTAIQEIHHNFDLTKQNVKRVRNLTVTIVVLLALLGLAIGFAWYADKQTDIAIIERDNAEQKTRLANAHAYSAISEVTIDEFPQLSGLFAVEAINATKKDEVVAAAEQAARNILASISGFGFPADGAKKNVLNTKWLATSKGDGKIRIWDISEDPFHPKREVADQGVPIAIGSNGQWMLSRAIDGTTILWNLHAENLSGTVRVLHHDFGLIEDGSFTSDGRWLVTLSNKTTENDIKRVQIWDLKSVNPEAVSSALLNESGELWEGNNAELKIGPRGRWLIIQTYDGKGWLGDESSIVQLWDLWSDEPVKSVGIAWNGFYRDVVFGPEGRWLAISEGISSGIASDVYETGEWPRFYEEAQMINLWDLNSNTPLKIVHRLPHFTVDQAGRSWIVKIKFGINGHWLASGSDDGSVRLWDLQSETPSLKSLLLSEGAQRLMGPGVVGSVGVSDMATDPNGHWLAAAKGQNVILWNLKANEPAKSIQSLPGHKGEILSVDIDPTGRWLVTGATDRTVRLWDLHALFISKTVQVLRGHEGEVSIIGFDPTGQWLITHGHNARIHHLSGQNLTQHHSTVVNTGSGTSSSTGIDPSGRWLVTSRNRHGQIWKLRDESPPLLTNEWPFAGSVEPYSTYTSGGSSWRFSSEGSHLISHISHTIDLDETANTINSVSYWNLNNRLIERRLRVIEGYEYVGYMHSPNGRWVLEETTEGREFTRLWDSKENKVFMLEAEELSTDIATAVFSPNNRWLAIVQANDPIIRLWDLTSEEPGKVKFRLKQYQEEGENENPSIKFAFDNSGRWLVTSHDARGARIWDLEDNKPSQTYRTVYDLSNNIRNQTRSIRIGPNGRWLAVTGDKSASFRLWDLDDDSQSSMRLMTGHKDGLTSIAISPGGRWIVTGGADKTIRIWDLNSEEPGGESITLSILDGLIERVIVDPTEHWLAIESDDGKIRLWNIKSDTPSNSEKVVGEFGKYNIHDIAFDRSGEYLMIIAPDTIYELRDLSSENPLQVIHEINEGDFFDVLEIESKGRWAVVHAGDSSFMLWDILKGDTKELNGNVVSDRKGGWLITTLDSQGNRSIKHSTRENFLSDPIVMPALPIGTTLLENSKSEIAVAIGPQNRWLVTQKGDTSFRKKNTVSLWDLATEDTSASVRNIECTLPAVIGPQGRWLATGGQENTILLWDLHTENLTLQSNMILRGHDRPVDALAIGSEGRWMISGSQDGTARLWDLNSINIEGTSRVFSGHIGTVEQVAINSQCNKAVTIDENGTVRLWDMKLDDLKDRLRKAIGRNMTAPEWKKYFPDVPYSPTFSEFQVPTEGDISHDSISKK